MNPTLRRRTFLTAVGAAGVAAVLPGRTATASSPELRLHLVEGSAASVALRPGPGADLLLHVARRFHYEIAALAGGDVRSTAAGTALVVLPGRFPAGARGGLFPAEVATVRDILADCAGAVRWGGDDRVHPQEGRFLLGAALIRPAGSRVPPGRMPDVFAPSRRRAATKLAERQVAAG